MVLRDLEIAAAPYATTYVHELFALLSNDTTLPDELRALAAQSTATRRDVNRLRHALLRYLGQTPGDWDMWDARSGQLDATQRTVRDYYIYLEEVRSPFNVGAIFRVAESFGIRRIFISPHSASPTHNRAYRSAKGAIDAVPWQTATLKETCEWLGTIDVFALETDGTPLEHVTFPQRGLALIGSEELGLSSEALAVATQSIGIASIATFGAKVSLNVSVAFGIMMHTWFAAGTV